MCRQAGPEPGPWCAPLYHYKASAVLAIPACLESLPGCSESFLTFPDFSDQVVIAILSTQGYDVKRFTRRSWAWQVSKLDSSRLHSLAPGIREVCEAGRLVGVLRAAAQSAWWQLPRAVLETIAETECVVVGEGGGLMERPMELTNHVLKCNEAAAIDILEHRLAAPLKASDLASGILEVDEAAS